MTFNIEHGQEGTEGIISYIEKESPSVLAIQEVKSSNPVVGHLKSMGFSTNSATFQIT